MGKKKDKGKVIVKNCTFQGPVWDGTRAEAVLYVAKGLCVLAELFKTGPLEALLVINPEAECKEEETD